MANATISDKPSRLVRWRIWIQAAFLVVWLDPLMLRMHTVCSPVFHCYACPLATFACPIGVIAQFSGLHVFPFLAVGTLLVVAGLFAGFVCGWACPFGFLQDLVAKIPTPKFQLPSWTSHIRYGVLAVTVIAVPLVWGEPHPLFICRLCPAGTLEGGIVNVGQAAVARVLPAKPAAAEKSTTADPAAAAMEEQGGDAPPPGAAGAEKTSAAPTPIPWPGPVKLVILGLFLVAMFVKWRPWCTILCPLGAIFGFFNRFSAVYLEYHPEACKMCNRCQTFCKNGIHPAKRISDPTCVRCLECTRCSEITVETVLSRPRKPTEPDPAK